MGKKPRILGKIWEGGRRYSIHISILVLVVAVIFSDFVWSDKMNINVAKADTDITNNVDAKKVDAVLAYVSQLVPPISTGTSTQSAKFLTESGGFLSKPSLPNTIISTLQRDKITNYTVSEGETYWTIAYKFEISIDTLRWANNISDLNDIKPGQQLIILPVNGLFYTAIEGDTLDSITSFYGIAKDKIMQQNALASADIVSGQQLILPGAKKYRDKTTNYYYAYTPGGEPYSGHITVGTGTFNWPIVSAKHFISQYFVWVTKWYKHTGLDMDWRNELDIYASDRGTVVSASYGWGGGYGNHII